MVPMVLVDFPLPSEFTSGHGIGQVLRETIAN